MDFQKHELGLGAWLYNVEFSREEGDRILSRAVEYVRKDVSVPGYRKGNVPDSILFFQFGEKINDAFKDFLEDAVISSIKKEHPKTIASYVLLHLGQNENGNFFVSVKVSDPTEILFPSDEEIGNDLKSLSFVKYEVDQENFSLTPEIEEVLKSQLDKDKEIKFEDGSKYIVGVEFKFSSGKEVEYYEVIDLYIDSGDKEMKSLFDGRNLTNNNTIKLTGKVKKLIEKDYIPNFLGVGEEIKLDDNARLVYIQKLHRYIDELPEGLKDPKKVAKYFSLALDIENNKRLETKCLSLFVKKYGFSLNEDDFLKEFFNDFTSSIFRLSRTPVHVFVPYIDMQLIKQRSLNTILQREFYKRLSKYFFGSSSLDNDKLEDSIKKVLPKLYESVGLSTVKLTTKEIKEEKPFIFANIIKNILEFE